MSSPPPKLQLPRGGSLHPTQATPSQLPLSPASCLPGPWSGSHRHIQNSPRGSLHTSDARCLCRALSSFLHRSVCAPIPGGITSHSHARPAWLCLYPPGLSTTCIGVTGGQGSLSSITGRQLMPIPDGMTPSQLWEIKVFSPFLPQLFIMQMSKHTEKLKDPCGEHPHTLYLDSVTVDDVLPFFCTHMHKFPLFSSSHIHTVYTHPPCVFYYII